MINLEWAIATVERINKSYRVNLNHNYGGVKMWNKEKIEDFIKDFEDDFDNRELCLNEDEIRECAEEARLWAEHEERLNEMKR